MLSVPRQLRASPSLLSRLSSYQRIIDLLDTRAHYSTDLQSTFCATPFHRYSLLAINVFCRSRPLTPSSASPLPPPPLPPLATNAITIHRHPRASAPTVAPSTLLRSRCSYQPVNKANTTNATRYHVAYCPILNCRLDTSKFTTIARHVSCRATRLYVRFLHRDPACAETHCAVANRRFTLQ